MSNTLMTLAAFATGLASVAAIAGYHLLLPSPGVAFASGGSAVDAKKSEPPSNPSIKTLNGQRVELFPGIQDLLGRHALELLILRNVGLDCSDPQQIPGRRVLNGV